MVRHQSEREPDHLRLAARGPIFESAGEGRHVREQGPLGEETRDLRVGIHALLQLAVELQENAVAIDHGRIALLGLQHARLRRACVALREQRALAADDRARARFRARHEAVDRRAECARIDSVEEHGLMLEFRGNGQRRPSGDALGADARRDLQRHEIGLGWPFRVVRTHEEQVGTGDLRRIEDGELLRRARLAAEPPAARDVAGEDLFLQHAPGFARLEDAGVERGGVRGDFVCGVVHCPGICLKVESATSRT